MGGVGGDDPVPIVVELGHGEIGFDRAGLVQPLRVRDHAGVTVDVVGRQLVQQPAGVATLHEELRHERHVHHDHVVASRLVLGSPVVEPVLSAPRQPLDHGFDTFRGEPVRTFPAADVLEVTALQLQPLMDRRHLGVARRVHRPARVVALVDHPERLDRARGPVLGVRLVAVQPIDVEAGDVDVGLAGQDPVRQHPAHAATGEDADRVHAGGDEVVPQLRGLADDRQQVGGEALRPAEERADARLHRDRHAAHRPLDVRTHPIPVGLDHAEREVVGDAADVPRRAHRLEQPDHQPTDLFAVVAEVGGVLDHRPVAGQPIDLLGDEVVVLGGLQRDVDAGDLAQLSSPHPGAVDDELGTRSHRGRCARR